MRFAGRPCYAAGAENLHIVNAAFCESGASGPGWAWTHADLLKLNGYAGDAIGAEVDSVVTRSLLHAMALVPPQSSSL